MHFKEIFTYETAVNSALTSAEKHVSLKLRKKMVLSA